MHTVCVITLGFVCGYDEPSFGGGKGEGNLVGSHSVICVSVLSWCVFNYPRCHHPLRVKQLILKGTFAPYNSSTIFTMSTLWSA